MQVQTFRSAPFMLLAFISQHAGWRLMSLPQEQITKFGGKPFFSKAQILAYFPAPSCPAILPTQPFSMGPAIARWMSRSYNRLSTGIRNSFRDLSKSRSWTRSAQPHHPHMEANHFINELRAMQKCPEKKKTRALKQILKNMALMLDLPPLPSQVLTSSQVNKIVFVGP